MKITKMDTRPEARLIYTAKAFSTMLRFMASDHAKDKEFMFLGESERGSTPETMMDFTIKACSSSK